MTVRRIPWPDGPAWKQEVTIDGSVYRMRGRWNEIGEFWSFDLLTRSERPIVVGVKVVLGALLTFRLVDERLPSGAFVVVAGGDCPCIPRRHDFEANARLVYLDAV